MALSNFLVLFIYLFWRLLCTLLLLDSQTYVNQKFK